MSRHVWTLILTDEKGDKWSWCIRCGALQRSEVIYECGAHQEKILLPASGLNRRKEAKKCPYKKQELFPKDIQQWINDLGNSCGYMALDEQVHDLKGVEASDINNGGVDSQIRYLHDEAGMPWSEIRGLLDLEKKE